MHRKLIGCFMLAALLAGCAAPNTLMPSAIPTATVTLAQPQVRVTRAPGVKEAVQQLFTDWQQGDTTALYATLSAESRAKWTQEQVSQVYENLANEATLAGLDYAIGAIQIDPQRAFVETHITYHTNIFGDFERAITLPWALEGGEWRLVWAPELVLPELAGGNRLGFERSWNGRGNIFDQGGKPLVAEVKTAAIGVWPDYADLEKTPRLPALLAPFSAYNAETIYGLIRYAQPGAYVPIGEVTLDQDPQRLETLRSFGSVVISEYSRRMYYGGGVASHVTGFVSTIQPDELASYLRRGYRAEDLVGRKGIELWGEKTLIGKMGGRLYVFNPEGQPVGELGSAPAEPGQDITLTIQRDFQSEVQKALSVFDGAIVALERDSGRVLAMASSPSFDPNIFDLEGAEWSRPGGSAGRSGEQSQFNRAAEGQYPLGSVFKLITISAALESGKFTPESTYDCQYSFLDLQGMTLYDWTWDHFQEDGKTKPSGLLTLPQGLARSCNPWFWHIGLELFNSGADRAISEMARSFGLGSKTGIEGIEEETGNVPDAGTAVDATNLAIGQGELLVTPLQVARFVAALGNGGTLYRPQLIEKYIAKNGTVTGVFQKEAQGALPLKPAHLSLIQEAMRGVIYSQKPEGTAMRVLGDLKLRIAGKTGTATTSLRDPHAWFAGFSEEGREDLPDIAVVVIAEFAGEGSEVAAPIFRRVMELYFFGEPKMRYPWEATFNVTRSPTVPVTAKPPTVQPGLHP